MDSVPQVIPEIPIDFNHSSIAIYREDGLLWFDVFLSDGSGVRLVLTDTERLTIIARMQSV